MSDYCVRKFRLTKEGSKEERIVKQFHYTAWPDHGVPTSCTSVLNFVRKSTRANPSDAGPMASKAEFIYYIMRNSCGMWLIL